MKDYSIYVTDDIATEIMNCGFRCLLSCGFFTHEFTYGNKEYKTPTAEEVCGWLREKGIQVGICEIDLRYKCTVYRNCSRDLAISETSDDYGEALLSGIRRAISLV